MLNSLGCVDNTFFYRSLLIFDVKGEALPVQDEDDNGNGKKDCFPYALCFTTFFSLLHKSIDDTS